MSDHRIGMFATQGFSPGFRAQSHSPNMKCRGHSRPAASRVTSIRRPPASRDLSKPGCVWSQDVLFHPRNNEAVAVLRQARRNLWVYAPTPQSSLFRPAPVVGYPSLSTPDCPKLRAASLRLDEFKFLRLATEHKGSLLVPSPPRLRLPSVTESVVLPPVRRATMSRIQPKAPLQDRLMPEAMRLKEEANELPPGPLRDARIRKARQAVTASHVNEWLSSPGLQAPQ